MSTKSRLLERAVETARNWACEESPDYPVTTTDNLRRAVVVAVTAGASRAEIADALAAEVALHGYATEIRDLVATWVA